MAFFLADIVIVGDLKILLTDSQILGSTQPRAASQKDTNKKKHQ